MRLCLVGADFEENLGVGSIASCARASGHDVRIVAFNDPREVPSLARAVADSRPDVVGLSLQFQHRAQEFAALARALRAAGFAGHLTCGGMLATAAWREVLAIAAFDSVVLYEGEHTVGDLLAALEAKRPLASVPGLAIRGDDGGPLRTADRARPEDLDALPFPARYRPHSRHLGVPFIPVLGARGCWGRCAFCSISSFHLDARAHGGGRLLRLRSPESLAREIASLAGDGPALACFHDDNFLLPSPADSLARVRALRQAFDALAPGPLGIIGKTRPECLTSELAKELRALGVVRLYVGVENTSEASARHLAREVQTRHVRQALAACREAGIFACYNLLVFEPDATVEDVRANVAFIREQAVHPVNFCRAEAYTGTPLHRELARRDALTGSWMGWNYRLKDDRAELLFRVCSAAFRERNFAPEGVANRSMSLGYCAKVLETFYPETDGQRARLARRAEEVTRSITRETADFLDEAISLADLSDRDAVERQTALLGLRICAADQVWHAAMDELLLEMEGYAKRQGKTASPPASRFRRIAKQVALGASLVLGGAPACFDATVDPAPGDAGRLDGHVVDPVPGPIDASDPVPRDAGARDIGWADPPPRDAGVSDATVADPLPPDGMVGDQLPPDDGGMMVDPAPLDGGWSSREPAGQWRDSATYALRSTDLPLFDPPAPKLSVDREGDVIRARLIGVAAAATVRWEAEGAIEGEGLEVRWSPVSTTDALRAAVRTAGGIAVVSVRAAQVRS